MRRTGTTIVISLAMGLGTAGVAVAAPAPVPTRTVTGIVQEVVREDPHGEHQGERDKILRVGNDVVALAPDALPTADNGDTVRATLTPGEDGEQRVLASREVAAAAEAADTTVHDVHIAIVTPAGVAADPALTVAAVTTQVNAASAYWSSQTNGQVKLRVASSRAPYTSALSCSAGSEAFWDEALTELAVPANGNHHLLVVVPTAAYTGEGCDYGYGSIGTWNRYPGLTFIADLNQSIIAHELGHNLGLEHAGALHCSAPDAAYSSGWPSTCSQEEYGDLLDVMGLSGRTFGEGSLNAVNVDRMGYLPSAVRTITAEGTSTVRIAPLSADPASLRAVKITDRAGSLYYVEYRTNAGRDAVATSNWRKPSTGVRVLRQHPGRKNSSSLVLDPTPTGKGQDYQNGLAVGSTFTSVAGLVRVTVDAADADGATLTVVNGTPSAPVVPASAVLSGLPGTAVTGETLTAKVTVQNTAGRPVPNWDAELQFAPEGSTGFTALKTVRTGTDGTASAAVAAPGPGTYRYVTAATAAVPAVTGNAVTVSLKLPPARAVLTGLPVKATVGAVITASVAVENSAGAPVPGWAVELQRQVRGTTGYTTAATGTTNAAGVATFRLAHQTAASYRYVTAGTADAPAVTSNVVVVASQAAVSLRRPATSVKRNTATAVTGSISPVPSPVVYVQVRKGSGAWSDRRRAVVRGTAVTGAVTFTGTGTYGVRFRLVTDTGSRYVGGYSGAYWVKSS